MLFGLAAISLLVRVILIKKSRQNGQTLQLSSVLLLSLLQANFCITREELNELHVTLKATGNCLSQVLYFKNNYSLCKLVQAT